MQKKTQQDCLVAACFILHMHFLFHIFPTMERDPPSCPLSSSDDTAAMDKNHQFVWVGKGIVTHEDEGKWLFGFEVILQGRQADINEVTMACERGPRFSSLILRLPPSIPTLAESKQCNAE